MLFSLPSQILDLPCPLVRLIDEEAEVRFLEHDKLEAAQMMAVGESSMRWLAVVRMGEWSFTKGEGGCGEEDLWVLGLLEGSVPVARASRE